MTIELVEYTLHLNTGEVISVSEFDANVITDLTSPEVMRAITPVLKRCTFMPRSVIEEAKMGYTAKFESLMRTSPIGAMLKLDIPICGMIKDCASAIKTICTTRNIEGKLGNFPICWEVATPRLTPDDIKERAQRLAFVIIHSWRMGKYVLLVDVPADLI